MEGEGGMEEGLRAEEERKWEWRIGDKRIEGGEGGEVVSGGWG